MSSNLPILFSGPMVRRLLAEAREPGTGKTMTRRLAWRDAKFGLQDYASEQLEDMEIRGWNVVKEGDRFRVFKPTAWQRVKPGRRLWVRERAKVESIGIGAHMGHRIKVRYVADGAPSEWIPFPDRLKYQPMVGKCLNMGCYREASRIALDVTATKIEELEKISEGDAIAEGIEKADVGNHALSRFIKPYGLHIDGQFVYRSNTAVEAFISLWDGLHGEDAWAEMHETGVVALTFTVHACNIDQMKEAA